MTWRSIVVGAGVASMVWATSSLASEAWPLMAYQPVSLPNGIALTPVSYIGYYMAGQAVEMACWENRIWHREEKKDLQENAAFAAGINASMDWRGWPDRGDTLRVNLDLSRVAAGRDENGWSDTTLVEATVECMRANAGQFAPSVHYLAVKIDGAARYARYAGVFDVRGYKCGPAVRQYP
jgi:hypothetical protein